MNLGKQADYWQRIYIGAARRLLPRRTHKRIALLLRLENVSLLTEKLGQNGIAYLLSQLSMRMAGTVRPEDFVQSPLQGVFTILLRDHSEIQAMCIAQRLQQSCQAALAVNGMTIMPVISGALVQAPSNQQLPVRQLMACGFSHLKQGTPEYSGRIRLIVHDPKSDQEDLPINILEACERGQIEAHFQPQICCNTGAVTGFEALARWQHPTRGLLTPPSFVPGMDKADHHALTHCMLQQCLSALQLWQAQGWNSISISLNVPLSELSDPDFAQSVIAELDRYGISPHLLAIEVLECIGPINSSDQICRNLQRLSDAGCPLDLDDFGTGYANLDSLRQFGTECIKIPRDFVTNCHTDPEQQRMVRAILAMAECLGIETVAEGVETGAEHSYLAQLGCDHVQGYAIARPMPLADIGDFMVQHLGNQSNLPTVPTRKTG